MHLEIYMPQRFFLFTVREAVRLAARLDVPKLLTCAYDATEKRICCYAILGSYSGGVVDVVVVIGGLSALHP
jgi:hypothetical protein